MQINEYQQKAARILLDRPDVPLSEEDTAEGAFWVSMTDAAAIGKKNKLNIEVAWPSHTIEEIDEMIRRLWEIHLERAKDEGTHDGQGSSQDIGSFDSTSQPDAK